MNIKYYIKNVEGLSLPKRANTTDAGYDVIATTDPIIKGTEVYDAYKKSTKLWSDVSYVEYGTNLYIVPDTALSPSSKCVGANDVHNVHTDLRPRSSISSKTNFVLANSVGLIDRGYHGQVMVRFKYIFQPADLRPRDGYVNGRVNPDKMYKKGEAIAQILPMLTHDIDFEMVDELPGENRGGGFGSSDLKKILEVAPITKKTSLAPVETDIFSRGATLGRKITISDFLSNLMVVPILVHGVTSLPELINKAEMWARGFDGDIYSYTENGKYGICVVSSDGDIIGKFEVGSLFN